MTRPRLPERGLARETRAEARTAVTPDPYLDHMADPFDLDGPVLAESREFTVPPAHGGGWRPFGDALARLLTSATDEGLWWATICLPEEVGNPAFAHLGPDEGGALYTEVAGDYYLPPAARLSPDQWSKLRELGWGDPVPDLSGDDEIQPRNHTRSWPMADLRLAVEHVLGTLQVVYGFSEHDPVIVALDPFT